MKLAGLIGIVIGIALLVFGLIIGTEVRNPFGPPLRVMNLPNGILGGVLLLAGTILLTRSPSRSSDGVDMSANQKSDAPENAKWSSLVEFDDDIASAAAMARELGPEYEQQLATAYLALGDKAYLPAILKKLTEKHQADRMVRAEIQAKLPGEIQRRIDCLFSVSGKLTAASLVDGRAVGWIGDRYEIFPSMAAYRSALKDTRAVYIEETDMASKDAFASSVAHLSSEIVRAPAHTG